MFSICLLNGNNLANVWREILNKKRLTDFELREITEKVTADVKNIDSRNVGIRDGNVEDRDKSTGGISCTDEDTSEASTRNFDQRENLSHIRSPSMKGPKMSLN